MGEIIWNISGGGSKIFGEAAVVEGLIDKNISSPTIITGVSAGAYLALPIAMRLFNGITLIQSQFNLKTLFDPSPVNSNGNISAGAILRVIGGKYWLGDQTKSLELLQKVITEDIFNAYKKNAFNNQKTLGYPECYILSVDFRSGSNNLVRVRDLTYQEYLNQTLASGSIPVFTKGVEDYCWKFDEATGKYIKDIPALLFDGGIRNHIASTVLIEDLIFCNRKIDQVISIYARPKDYNIAESSTWMPSDISTSLTRTLDIMEMQLSKADEQLEKIYADKYGFKLTQIFLPSDILNGTYDVDSGRLKAFSDACYVIGNTLPTNSVYESA